MAQPPEQIQPKSLDDYLAVMSKAIFQSGMSWKVVETKWPGILEAFEDFDVEAVAAFETPQIEALTGDRRVIRNGRKIEAIVANARRMRELDQEHGGFLKFLRAHGDFDATYKALHKEFKFMGPMASYYFLYVVGEQVPPHHEFEARYRK
jgi:3-methyladenine DNA glycosylase Tag